MELDFYNRQKQLKLKVPSSATVIGLGGIGSWVALNLALTGTNKLVLIDYDRVEEHNLNRTPFTIQHIGLLKTQALSELIIERRDSESLNIIPISKRFEELNTVELDMVKRTYLIVDCRDNLSPLPFKHKRVVKLGYDGHLITIHFNPSNSFVMGDGNNGYTIVPSWLCPPQFLANVITTYICALNHWPRKEKIVSLNLIELTKKVLKVRK